MENKNIDKLFQEQLKDLEATPNKKVWNNIESKLKKKKRSILPFWWFSSGIAALLILGLILYPFSKDKNLIEFKFKTKEEFQEQCENTDLDQIKSIVKGKSFEFSVMGSYGEDGDKISYKRHNYACENIYAQAVTRAMPKAIKDSYAQQKA